MNLHKEEPAEFSHDGVHGSSSNFIKHPNDRKPNADESYQSNNLKRVKVVQKDRHFVKPDQAHPFILIYMF